MGRVSPPFNVVISNVPGPQFPLYSAGATLQGIYPLSAIADGVGLNMTMMSYNGNLDFGLLADREMVPDIWNMITALGDELETLVKAAGEQPPDPLDELGLRHLGEMTGGQLGERGHRVGVAVEPLSV